MNKEQILDQLKPMMDKAKAKGLWFRSCYQNIWFSPTELQAEWNNGKFIWGPINWELCDPKEQLAQLDKNAKEAQTAADKLRKKLK
jgi:hypothetical protein